MGSQDLFGFPKMAYRFLCHSERRFYTASTGYYGIGPSTTQKGDEVYILYGARVPFIVRNSASSKEGQKHKCDQSLLVGWTYIPGYMNGEAVNQVRKGVLAEKDFEFL